MIRKSDRWRPFYNISTLAAYHFELVQVTLDSVDDLIISALNNGTPAARNKVLPLAAHEYMHWIDHVASIWGRDLLFRYFRGVKARESGNEFIFDSMVDAVKAVNRSKSDVYYFFEGPQWEQGTPWDWSLSVGMRFNAEGKPDPNDPIPFVRFGKGDPNIDDNLIVRMPISAASLAEVRAMATEYLWVRAEHGDKGSSKTPADPKKWIQDFESKAYTPDFLIYTTALHLLANHTNQGNIEDIILHASELAWVALNFPSSLTSQLHIPSAWSDRWQRPNDGLDYVSGLLATQDPGFIYAVLCWHAHSPGTQNPEEWVDDVVLKAVGCTIAEFNSARQDAIERQKDAFAKELKDPRLISWLNLSDPWAESTTGFRISQALLQSLEGDQTLSLPPALTADFSLWYPNGDVVFSDGFADPLERVKHYEDRRDRIDEFIDVCGY